MKNEKEFEPILAALQRILRHLKATFPSSLIIGAPSLQQLQEKKLPEHVRVIPKKRLGPRVPVRRKWRHHLHIATWPNDRMIEGAVPLLACVVAGEADFQIADYALCCRTGDCVLFPVNAPRQDGSQPHFEGDATGRRGEILWIYTGGQTESGLTCWITQDTENLSLRPPDAHCRVEHRFLAQLFKGFCMEAFHGHNPEITLQIQSVMLALLLAEIARGNALKDWGRPRYHGRNEKNPSITEALIYIEEYLDQRLTVDKVARQVFLSSSTFSRLFKQETGQTFLEYQTQRRMEIAEELLKTTNRPILAIGRRVGLKDGQLRALFHQRHGCSPSEYRKQKTTK